MDANVRAALESFSTLDNVALAAGRTIADALASKYPDVSPEVLADILSDVLVLAHQQQERAVFLRLLGATTYDLVNR